MLTDEQRRERRARIDAAREKEAREVEATEAHIRAEDLTVHRVGYAGMPDIEIECAGSTTAWGAVVVMPHLFRLPDGRLYTFTERLATCEGCKAGRKA